jgi:threonine dehydratase
MSSLPTLEGIENAAALIHTDQPETPLVRVELLSRGLDADVWIKVETVSPIGCFKIRGALNDIKRAKERGPVDHVVTSSSGNHGQGVAYAARLLGLKADIYLPKDPNPLKAAMIRALGASIRTHGDDSHGAKAEAKRFAKEHGFHFVDDGDSLDLTEGAGTVGLEIAQALDGIDEVYVPVGDAALVNGSACALKALQPAVKVIGVQARGAPALTESFRVGHRVEIETNTIADGLATRAPAPLALAGMARFVDDFVLVEDEEMLASIHSMAECTHVLTEPSGAAALAGAWKRCTALRGKRVVLVISGANVTMDVLRQALTRSPLIAVNV